MNYFNKNQWNLMRVLRLGLGVAIFVQGIIAKDWMLGLLGIGFSIMPLLNIGCCAMGNCSVPMKPTTKKESPITYEEVH